MTGAAIFFGSTFLPFVYLIDSTVTKDLQKHV